MFSGFKRESAEYPESANNMLKKYFITLFAKGVGKGEFIKEHIQLQSNSSDWIPAEKLAGMTASRVKCYQVL